MARGRSAALAATDAGSNGDTEMKRPINDTNVQPGIDDERARGLMALIDELIQVIEDENAELAKGLPASRLKQVDAKARLAEVFERWVAECTAGCGAIKVQNRQLRDLLVDRILQLRGAMDENLIRLRAAIEASHRRIDAVMQAIREQLANKSPYGAAGTRAARPLSCGTSLRA